MSMPLLTRSLQWVFSLLLLPALSLLAADRSVDPTFLRCSLGEAWEQQVPLSTPTCHYKPIFGEGSPGMNIVRGISRFGEVSVDPGGNSVLVEYPQEEQICFIMEGTGSLWYRDQKISLRKDDFMYIPPGLRYGIFASPGSRCRLIVAGFRIVQNAPTKPRQEVLLSNLSEVPKQTVAGHPPTVLYQLMIGDTKSTRDKIAAGQVVTSVYLMEFAPGGTNFPHHHEREEEIYLVLDGHGEMVAGGGLSGIEGRYPVRAGDAFFFRLNCTAGFYNDKTLNVRTHVLGIRSLFPFADH
jgi:mannose-6-phosphate isomerase-like protein (cupin superfamily)